MEAEKVNYPIAMMCKVLKVARSGYYKWLHRGNSVRSKENKELSAKIQQIHQTSRQSYGSPRIHAALQAEGLRVGRGRVMRLMAKLGIFAHPKRKFKATTDSKHALPITENLLNRDFIATEPDRSWVADISVP